MDFFLIFLSFVYFSWSSEKSGERANDSELMPCICAGEKDNLRPQFKKELGTKESSWMAWSGTRAGGWLLSGAIRKSFPIIVAHLRVCR